MNPSIQMDTITRTAEVAHATAGSVAGSMGSARVLHGLGSGGDAAFRVGIHQRPQTSRIDAGLIRLFDVVVSSILLILLVPVIAIAALAIKLDSPGPVFYRARRLGHGGRELLMLKFRKMGADAGGLALTMDDDHRFTRIGMLLAKFKIDEIPQLWNVLGGQMSLVGPRPESPEFVRLHADDYRSILSVRPGITGLSQIAFAEESRILDDHDPLNHYVDRLLPQKVGLDKMYTRKRTLAFNVRILCWTAAAIVMRRQVAVHRGSAKMNLRKR